MAGKDVARVVNRCYAAAEDGHLDLSACKLESFPDAVFFLTQKFTITSIDLSGNYLKKVSTKFCNSFEGVSCLSLCGNHLSTLPAEVRKLVALVELNISENEFDLFPDVLYQLPHLKILNASCNQIKDVDVDTLASSTSLKCVDLSENPLSWGCYESLLAVRSPEIRLSHHVTDTDVD